MNRELPGTDGESVELRRCPFCGRDVAVFTNCLELEACKKRECDDSHYYAVVCTFSAHPKGCGASTGFYPTAAEAADAWNARKGCIDPAEIETLLAKHTYGIKQA